MCMRVCARHGRPLLLSLPAAVVFVGLQRIPGGKSAQKRRELSPLALSPLLSLWVPLYVDVRLWLCSNKLP